MKFETELEFYIKTDFPIAYESLDYLNPWGTAKNNSTNARFNEKIYTLFNHVEKPIKILDMGCSGGGFVRKCIDDGCIAVGVEGSDYSKKLRRAEWKTIPGNLFTCDITKPFSLSYKNGNKINDLRFDLITCWEVMEHIKEEDINSIAENVKNHLLPSGLWIMSVSPIDDIVNGVNLHETVKPKKWWVERFLELGFTHRSDLEQYFNQQYIRGKKYNGPSSFHLILTPNISESPQFPHYPLSARIYDLWRGSKVHKLVNLFTQL